MYIPEIRRYTNNIIINIIMLLKHNSFTIVQNVYVRYTVSKCSSGYKYTIYAPANITLNNIPGHVRSCSSIEVVHETM